MKKAFTLIELLVVIAIIALLLAILMPSLTKAKRVARDVVCRTHLKQWGVVSSLYTNDNDGKFGTWDGGALWSEMFRNYYTDAKLRLCPEAQKMADPLDAGGIKVGSSRKSWGVYDVDDYSSNGSPQKIRGDFGSYGTNNWASSPVPGSTKWKTLGLWGKTSKIQESSYVPLFMDCIHKGGKPDAGFYKDGTKDAFPEESEEALLAKGQSRMTSGLRMHRFVVDTRHDGNINVVFADYSVSKVSIKQLWRLKWYKEYTTPDIDWSDPKYSWARKIKE